MIQDINQYIKSCQICATSKQKPGAFGKLHSILVRQPFEMVGVDILGPLPRTKNNNAYIVVFMNYLTKWSEAFTVQQADLLIIANFIVNKIISRHKMLKKLLSDLGQSFLLQIAQNV